MKMTAKQLSALYLRQSVALAATVRKIADMKPPYEFSSLDVHNFSGCAPVVIQITATRPGSDLGGSVSLRVN